MGSLPAGGADHGSGTAPDLRPLLRPRSIAVIGASQREVRANRVIRNLQAVGYGGEIHPINPNYPEVLGLRCYPDVASTPAPVDCAVVAIPAARVPDVLTQAADAGVRSAIVLASGFAEAGEEGRLMQSRLEALARDRDFLICGPNCFGVLNVAERAAAFIGIIPQPLVAGNVALVSQSGGLTNIVVPPLMELRAIGFSHVVSCGNQAGVTVEDYISYLVEDDATEVIAAFVEGFKRPRELMAIAARAIARGKPIVVLKVGRSEVAQRAALAHTGSLVGAAEVAEAVFRRAGIVQVHSVEALTETIALLSDGDLRERFTRGRSRTGRLRPAVMTSTGGLVGYVGDAAADLDVELPPLASPTKERLAAILPEFAGATNPLDGTGAMYDDPTLFPNLVTPLAEDPGVDVVAINLDFTRIPRAGADVPRTKFVPSIVELAPRLSKPLVVFTSRSGATSDPAIAEALRAVHVPLLDGIEHTLIALRGLARFSDARVASLDGALSDAGMRPRRRERSDLPSRPPDTLTAMRLLKEAGIPVAPVELARTEDEAVAAARRLGLPVALKVESPAIAHKSDVGGVILDLRTTDAVRDGFRSVMAAVAARVAGAPPVGVIVQRMGAPGVEVLLGVKLDPSFGPVVACGLGGIHTEIFGDIVVGIPPISPSDAVGMLQRLRSWPLLDGARGRPTADVPAVAEAIVALGELALALEGQVKAIDINPLLVYPAGQGVLAVDVLVEMTRKDDEPAADATVADAS